MCNVQWVKRRLGLQLGVYYLIIQMLKHNKTEAKYPTSVVWMFDHHVFCYSYEFYEHKNV